MMRPMTLGEIAAAVGCTDSYFLDNNAKITSISTDSRPQPEDGDRESCLFVALRGEVFDGHAYVGAALRNKAQYALVDKKGAEEYCKELPAQQLIVCEDTEQGFLDLAGAYRDRYHFRMVGVTGSVGKTTTKEMIAQVLSAQFETLKTQGNFNNRVGLPKTLLELDETVQAAVIEMGMNHFGEISDLTRRAKPDAAVITNIGITHIEQLGSQECILEEKLHIQEGMPPEGILFLNGDDPLLASVVPKEGRKKVLYGLGRDCDYRAEDLHLEEGYPVFTAVHGDCRVRVRLKVMGSHMVSNAMAALAVADTYGLSMEKAALALGQFKGYKGRQQIFEWGGVTVIDDSYNASPVSMKAGLEVLDSVKGERKIAVLADMKELGPDTERFHAEIGAYIGEHPLDMVLLLGELAACIGSGMDAARAATPHIEIDSLAQAEKWLDENIREGDCILFKGSNSMKLSEAVKHLKETRS